MLIKIWAGLLHYYMVVCITALLASPSQQARLPADVHNEDQPYSLSLLEVNPDPFIDAAQSFELNEDFNIKGFESFVINESRTRDGWSHYEDMREILYKNSHHMMTVMALSDKLVLSDIIRNLPSNETSLEDQVKMLFSAQLTNNESLSAALERLKGFEKVLEKNLRPMYLKCTHLSGMRGNDVIRGHEEISAIKSTLHESVTDCASLQPQDSDTPAMKAIRRGIVVQSLFPTPPLGELGHYKVRCFSRVDMAELTRLGPWTQNPSNGLWTGEEGEVLDRYEDSFNPATQMTEKYAILWEPKELEAGKAPIEVRVQTIWGKAHTAVYYPLPFGGRNPNNCWIVKNVHGHWQTKFLRFKDVKKGMHCASMNEYQRGRLSSLLERHMPVMVRRAEEFARALGVPFLRVDFFVRPETDCEEKCLTLNEVAQNSDVQYHDPDPGMEIENSHEARTQSASPKLIDLVRALVVGYQRRDGTAPRKPPMYFFSKLGCRQKNTSELPSYEGLTCKKEET